MESNGMQNNFKENYQIYQAYRFKLMRFQQLDKIEKITLMY